MPMVKTNLKDLVLMDQNKDAVVGMIQRMWRTNCPNNMKWNRATRMRVMTMVMKMCGKGQMRRRRRGRKGVGGGQEIKGKSRVRHPVGSRLSHWPWNCRLCRHPHRALNPKPLPQPPSQQPSACFHVLPTASSRLPSFSLSIACPSPWLPSCTSPSLCMTPTCHSFGSSSAWPIHVWSWWSSPPSPSSLFLLLQHSTAFPATRSSRLQKNTSSISYQTISPWNSSESYPRLPWQILLTVFHSHSEFPFSFPLLCDSPHKDASFFSFSLSIFLTQHCHGP